MTGKAFYQSGDGVRLCALVSEAEGAARGSVVLAHGITVDKDESSGSTGIGAFVQLDEALRAAGFNVLRFDYRGHGESGGRQEGMTIAGELLDLEAALTHARQRWGMPPALVAASFGAVSAVLYAAGREDLPCLVLWNPVLDLVKTFLEPVCPRPRRSFNAGDAAFLERHGYLLLDSFRVGRRLLEEMREIRPYERMREIRCPVLTLHGDRDSYVPYDVARDHAACNDQSEFAAVAGADHGFGRKEDRGVVIPKTVAWVKRFTPRAGTGQAGP
ncbi:MAG: alpha/beta hydrolase [Patescibacteria group bacterium]